MAEQQAEKSKLALAIEQRKRKLHKFEVQGYFGLGNKPIHKIGIRVAVKADEDAAIVAAHRAVKELSGGAKEAMEDFDLLGDAKLIQILFRVCFSVDDVTSDGVHYPAFYGPDWMRRNLTTDQIACLMNLYHEVRKAEGPTKWDIDLEDVEAIATGVARMDDSSIPETALAAMSREWLSSAFVLLAIRYTRVKQELEDVRTESGHLGSEGDSRGEGRGAVEPDSSDENAGG